MKRGTIFAMALCLAVAIIGCGAPQAEPTTPNTYLPTVMVDGKLYRSTFQKLAEDEVPSEITGTIRSTVPLSKLPEENGQANFDAPDAPYVLTDAALAVFWNEEWVLFATDDRQAAPITEQHSDVVTLTFPGEASDSVPGNNYGTDAGWNWTFQNLSTNEVLSLFGEENELLLGGAPVDGLDDLSAEGYFDTEGVAQNMTVQGWPDDTTAGVGVFHPLFKIDLFRRDSRMYRTETPGENAHAAENAVFGVPVRVYWAKSKIPDADTFYYAIFETDELAVYCSTISTGRQDEESAKALLSRIVWQCLAPEGGLDLDAAKAGYIIDHSPQTEIPSQTADASAYSFSEGAVFTYDGISYDLAERYGGINAISDIRRAGKYLVIDGHVGPKNGMYCIFDTESATFVKSFPGANLIWQGDDLATAIYNFWSSILDYDGNVLIQLDLPESEYIYSLGFSDIDNEVAVNIVLDDGNDRTELYMFDGGSGKISIRAVEG